MKCSVARASVEALVITAAALACKGDTGSVGPNGDPGPKGDTGTANVIYSNWTNFVAANWVRDTEFYGDTIQLYPITADSLTSTIATNGVVLVYARLGNPNGVVEALPVVRPLTQPVIQELSYFYKTGTITIEFRNITNGNNPGAFGSGNDSYRYILIPGGVPGTSSVAGDLSYSYDRVVERLGIPK